MLASIDLPVEVFIVEANVNVLTSLLFLRKKPAQVVQQEDLANSQKDYPIFMAVADRVGFDRRGNTLYKRGPDGEEILVDKEEREQIRIGGKIITRVLKRKQRVVDDDLLLIAERYQEFLRKHAQRSL